MKNILLASLIASALLSTSFAKPAFAEWDPHHPGAVVPAYCTQQNPADAAYWVDYHGQHAITVVTDNGSAGFIVYGNLTALAHHQVPGGTSGVGAGPIPPGQFSFRVFSSSVADPTFNYVQSSNTGCFLTFESIHAVNGVISGKIDDSQGPVVGQIQVYSDNEIARYVVGDFAINGVPLPGAAENVNLLHGLGFCSFDNYPNCN